MQQFQAKTFVLQNLKYMKSLTWKSGNVFKICLLYTSDAADE